METFYLFLVIFLFVLAIVDLSVGVSNDAVNFLNSAFTFSISEPHPLKLLSLSLPWESLLVRRYPMV